MIRAGGAGVVGGGGGRQAAGVSPEQRSLTEYWPVFGLQLATPRLTLAPLRDDDLVETIDVILAGIHPADRMPFAMPWTDAPRDELISNTLRYYWTTRGASTPESWVLPFVVRRAGAVVGLQELTGKNFAVTSLVGTGSWVGAAYQNEGIGTEMRSTVLQFAFDHLKAQRADSDAFLDNPASLRVSAKLGYRNDGTVVVQRRPGERAVGQRLTLDNAHFVRPGWDVQVRGLPVCRSFFG
jgi:RimJ/RimL family protein N-acetyltransferase